MLDSVKEHVKKTSQSTLPLRKGGGSTPSPQQKSFFSQNKRNCLKCAETNEYAKIFCELFARVSIKNFFSQYFHKILKLAAKNASFFYVLLTFVSYLNHRVVNAVFIMQRMLKIKLLITNDGGQYLFLSFRIKMTKLSIMLQMQLVM